MSAPTPKIELSSEEVEEIRVEAEKLYPLGYGLFSKIRERREAEREGYIAGATAERLKAKERHELEHDAHILEMMERNEIIQELKAKAKLLSRLHDGVNAAQAERIAELEDAIKRAHDDIDYLEER